MDTNNEGFIQVRTGTMGSSRAQIRLYTGKNWHRRVITGSNNEGFIQVRNGTTGPSWAQIMKALYRYEVAPRSHQEHK